MTAANKKSSTEVSKLECSMKAPTEKRKHIITSSNPATASLTISYGIPFIYKQGQGNSVNSINFLMLTMFRDEKTHKGYG
ncbi:hypothetical protein TUM4641_23790 [Shewanella morhuae]|nr:hypothetical protein TUM4641_23790 [Shewanella morhuae]